MDHFINYTPNSEMSMADLTVSDPKRAHIHFVIVYDHLTLNSQIPCEARNWGIENHFLCISPWHMFEGPISVSFNFFQNSNRCILPSPGALWNEWRDLLQGDLYSWGFFLPMCISAPEIWLQYCNISRVFSIAVTDLVDEGSESWSWTNLRNQVGS